MTFLHVMTFWVAVSSTVGLRAERRHHLQTVCLQDAVLVDQTGENRLGLSLVGKGIPEKTPGDVTACRREYLRTAPSSEELLDLDRLATRFEARTSSEFYPLCELISCILKLIAELLGEASTKKIDDVVVKMSRLRDYFRAAQHVILDLWFQKHFG
ncbi:hypothetical protein AVEN_173332-1 [Araneus ventricosus]|uniref:Uncharacterized protein n=1 Tax=Araneus ventricosus TaxID=182803 RepID=A0A4Y2T9W5_ARAVE|nr:hypothetical protein AVEN_173332-1 [Araneus ventricosus]